jgi:hypothetical protein
MKTEGNVLQKWFRVILTILEPMVLIPISLGFILLLYKDSHILKQFGDIISTLSAFGIGIGVNHFTTIYKEQKEFEKLTEKAEFTVRILNDRINSILRKETLSNNQKDTIENLLTVMDYWKEYYKGADTSKIGYLRKLIEELNNTTDINKQKQIKNEIEDIKMKLNINGVNSYIQISGSTIFNKIE